MQFYASNEGVLQRCTFVNYYFIKALHHFGTTYNPEVEVTAGSPAISTSYLKIIGTVGENRKKYLETSYCHNANEFFSKYQDFYPGTSYFRDVMRVEVQLMSTSLMPEDRIKRYNFERYIILRAYLFYLKALKKSEFKVRFYNAGNTWATQLDCFQSDSWKRTVTLPSDCNTEYVKYTELPNISTYELKIRQELERSLHSMGL